MLSVEHLNYRYHKGPMVLKNVSFQVEDGEFLAILGNNGVGKSITIANLGFLLSKIKNKTIIVDFDYNFSDEK